MNKNRGGRWSASRPHKTQIHQTLREKEGCSCPAAWGLNPVPGRASAFPRSLGELEAGAQDKVQRSKRDGALHVDARFLAADNSVREEGAHGSVEGGQGPLGVFIVSVSVVSEVASESASAKAQSTMALLDEVGLAASGAAGGKTSKKVTGDVIGVGEVQQARGTEQR